MESAIQIHRCSRKLPLFVPSLKGEIVASERGLRWAMLLELSDPVKGRLVVFADFICFVDEVLRQAA
jgi:hypothetical protein